VCGYISGERWAEARRQMDVKQEPSAPDPDARSRDGWIILLGPRADWVVLMEEIQEAARLMEPIVVESDEERFIRKLEEVALDERPELAPIPGSETPHPSVTWTPFTREYAKEDVAVTAQLVGSLR
jgi:hypothetical protein